MAQLSALLSLRGFDITAIERYGEHATTAHHMRQWLSARLSGAGRYVIKEGGVPGTGGSEVDANTVVVGLSICNRYPDDRWNKILDAFAPAAGVMLDLATFFVERRQRDRRLN